MKKLIIIDGSSILSTSFYGTIGSAYYSAKTEEEKQKLYKKILKTSTGIYTNAVYTMTKILLNLLKNQKPSHLAICWDVSRDTFRKQIYPAYKGQRKETPAPLKEQFQTMQNLLREMNIPQFYDKEYEADDFIGSVSKKFEKIIPTYIYTKDQDALQLVSPYTRLWLVTSKSKDMYAEYNLNTKTINVPEGAFEFTPLLVKEKYGVYPEQIPDYKGLIGDDSDNIPGVKGVGEKAVVPLLSEYLTIEKIYEVIEEISDKKSEMEFKKFLKEHLGINRSPISYLTKTSSNPDDIVGKASALLSKNLATIKRDIHEISSLDLSSLELQINEDGKRKEFKKLELKSLL